MYLYSHSKKVKYAYPTEAKSITPSPALAKEPAAMSKSGSKNMSEYYQENSGGQVELIDSLELNALRDTNDVLKSEVQRLSALESKLKSLSKEAAYLREANSKLESEMKELSALKIKCEKLEAEIKHLKACIFKAL